jgi:hypothetical protein
MDNMIAYPGRTFGQLYKFHVGVSTSPGGLNGMSHTRVHAAHRFASGIARKQVGGPTTASGLDPSEPASPKSPSDGHARYLWA